MNKYILVDPLGKVVVGEAYARNVAQAKEKLEYKQGSILEMYVCCYGEYNSKKERT